MGRRIFRIPVGFCIGGSGVQTADIVCTGRLGVLESIPLFCVVCRRLLFRTAVGV